jgi:type I restriction enzyme S subunit
MAKISATWKRVKFGEVVRLVKETCKAPVAAGIERVIGLEHLESGELRVRSWNDVADGTTFTTRVRPGQVLFGKRRAYQRKVAVADFDAICSGDIYVFESANPERLLPEVLPFICQTDAFFEHAVGTSAGSLSPRTNWSSLAEYEFALPPLETQRKIADELAALETARNDTLAARRSGEQFLEVLTWNLCTGKNAPGPRRETNEWEHARLPGVTSIPRDWVITRLTDVARLESGHTPSRSKPEYWHGGIPWISLADIQRLGTPLISETDEEIAQLGVENSSARLLPAGTVVLSRTAMIGFTSVTSRPMATSQDFANFICSDALNPTFVFWLFMGMKEFFDYTAIGSSNVKTIYMPFFQTMQIALPPRPVQDEIVEQLGAVRAQVDALRAREAEHARFMAILRESRIGGAA